jgi:hypothetical protein
MPLNPKAAFISDPGRATALFPATPCRQCNGAQKVQRYGTTTCADCGGSGEGEYKPDNHPADQRGFCAACYSDYLKKSTGKRAVPESIPCPGCGGQGTKRRVHDARPQTLASLKPGDWLVIGVEFPALPVEDASTQYAGASAELISCMVVRASPATSTIIMARVIHSPEYSTGHGLKYGDLLQLGPNDILVHSQCTTEEFEKAKAGGLFTFAPVNPMPPIPGKEFITRGGERSTVWTIRNEGQGQFAIGITKGGLNLEWNMDGTERQGRREFDLVQFAQVVNA